MDRARRSDFIPRASCRCGCGKPVATTAAIYASRDCYLAHAERKNVQPKEKSPFWLSRRLCECGCGLPCDRPHQKYIRDHSVAVAQRRIQNAARAAGVPEWMRRCTYCGVWSNPLEMRGVGPGKRQYCHSECASFNTRLLATKANRPERGEAFKAAAFAYRAELESARSEARARRIDRIHGPARAAFRRSIGTGKR